MRRGSLFWGSLILLVGIGLLIGNIFQVDIWNIIWPLVIVLLGAWLLVRPVMARRNIETQQVSVPLENASEADVSLHHGAGRLALSASGTPGVLLSGSCVGGARLDVNRSGPAARVDVRSEAGDYFFGFSPANAPYGFAWDMQVTPEIPLRLTLETGASESNIDLRDLKVTDFELKTGASASNVTLPARAGLTRVKVSSGAASVKLFLPEGVAGRIRVQSGLAGIHIDTNRFPAAAGGYETPGFDAAENKADIFVETGVGAVEVH